MNTEIHIPATWWTPALTEPSKKPLARHTLLLALGLLFTLVAAACGSNGTDLAAGDPSNEIPDETNDGDGADAAAGGSTFNPVAGSWTLQSLTIEGDMAIDLEGDFTTPTLDVTGTDISGSTSCNTYDGTVSYDIAGDTFSATELRFTEMACAEDIESFFLQALTSATTFALEDGALVLTDGAEFPTELRFAAEMPEDNPEDE